MGRKGWCPDDPSFPRRASIDLQWVKVWRNPTPISRRYPAAWTIILVDKGYGGVHGYPTRSWSIRGKSCPRLFTQLTRHVLGIAWARPHVRGQTPAHPRCTQLRRKLERSSNAVRGGAKTSRYLSAIERWTRPPWDETYETRSSPPTPAAPLHIFLIFIPALEVMDNGISVRERDTSLFNVWFI